MGDDAVVALPGFSCFDVATAAVGAAAKVVTYDIDPDTLAPNEASLREALARGARIVVVAPLYGMPVAWDRVEAIAAERGALVIEDAAQGHGATWRGRPLGSLGRVSTLSFSRGKAWTGGRGGAVLTRGDVSAASPSPRGLDLKDLLRVTAQLVLGRPSLYGVPRAIPGLNLGETVYHDPSPMTAMADSAASVLLANRAGSITEAEHRRANARTMLEWLGQIRGVATIRAASDAVPGYLRLPIRLKTAVARGKLLAAAERLGVAASYPMPLRELPAIASRVVADLPNPGAELLAESLATLPTHSLVTAQDIARIREALSAG
jgi:perosamine synthetase